MPQLEVSEDIMKKLTLMQQALQHKSPEQTLHVLCDLGMKAVTLTSREEPRVLLFSNDRKKQLGAYINRED